MSKAAFFTDEDVYAAVAVTLRKAGLDAVSTPEVGQLGESDNSQLVWAAGPDYSWPDRSLKCKRRRSNR